MACEGALPVFAALAGVLAGLAALFSFLGCLGALLCLRQGFLLEDDLQEALQAMMARTTALAAALRALRAVLRQEHRPGL